MLALAGAQNGVAHLKALPAPMAVLVGLAALAVATVEEIWQTAQHVNVIAHEGTHALVGGSLGPKVQSVTFWRNGAAIEGLTVAQVPTAIRRFFFWFSGYVGPSAFGLVGAKLISLGAITAVLWLAVALLAILLTVLRNLFSFGSVVVTGGSIFLVACYGTAGVETTVAYGLTWFLLISGVTVVLRHGQNAGDAGLLRATTHIHRAVWSGLWQICTITALVVGGGLLV